MTKASYVLIALIAVLVAAMLAYALRGYPL